MTDTMARSTRRAARAVSKASFTCAAALSAAAGIGAVGETRASAAHLEYKIQTLGFTDGVYFNATDNFRESTASLMNDKGFVVGRSKRWDTGGTKAQFTGFSGWLYDNLDEDNPVLRRVGLVSTDTDNGVYVQTSTSKQDTFGIKLNTNGVAAGQSQRYTNTAVNGQSVWIHRPGQDGESTRIGNLDKTLHTGANNFQSSTLVALNNAVVPQAIGNANRFTQTGSGAGATFDSAGTSAWFYNGASTIAIGLTTPGVFADGNTQFNEAHFLNDAGTVVGSAQKIDGSFSTSAWVHINNATTEIGYTDANDSASSPTPGSFTHKQKDTNFRSNSVVALNSNSQVAGVSTRFLADGTPAGQTAWLKNATGTLASAPTDISLTAPITGTSITHVSSDDSRSSTVQKLNDQGRAVGIATRYNGDQERGQSAWIYEGSGATKRIGLIDGVHTSSGAGSTGVASSSVSFLNKEGHAAGTSLRYTPGSDSSNGQSAWVYHGAGTGVRTGLTEADHERFVQDGTNLQSSTIVKLNDAGDAVGQSARFIGGTSAGEASYIYDYNSATQTGTTKRIGLFDPEDGPAGDWTNGSTGAQNSQVLFLNDAGQAAGISVRYNNNASAVGTSAWFYDSGLDLNVEIKTSPTANNSAMEWTVGFLSDVGEVVGSYRPFGNAGEERAYYYTLANGFHDLGQMVQGGLDPTPDFWESLNNAIQVSDAGHIRGVGAVEGGTYLMPFILTPVPEPTGIALLAMSGLALLPRRRRRA